MKKIICFVCSVIVLLSLFGCAGNNKTDDVRGTIETGEQTQPQSEPEFSLGKATGSTYKNDFLGISCTLPEGWTFYSDEKILEMNNLVGEYLDEDVAEQLEKATIVYDMYASSETDGSSINMNLEKLNIAQALNLDIKQTLEGQIDAIQTAYENMGYTDVKVTYQKITIDGKDFDSLKLVAKIQGIDAFTTTVAFKKGNYLANISLFSLQTDKADEILGCFTVE